MDVRALPDFGRPQGLSILSAVCLPKIAGKTSRALRARAKVSFVQTGFSRSARSGLRLRFIPFYLAFISLTKAAPPCNKARHPVNGEPHPVFRIDASAASTKKCDRDSPRCAACASIRLSVRAGIVMLIFSAGPK